MDRVFKIIFYGVLGLFFVFVIYMTTVMYISPRQDLQKRGFIPCTETLVYNITGCKPGQMMCPLECLWQDMQCNVRIVADGFVLWRKGKQERPWSNYLFEPKNVETEDELYVGAQNAEDTYESDAANLFIAAKRQELEKAKERQLNQDDSIILNNPEELNKIAVDLRYISKDEEQNPSSEDISDESLIGEIPENTTDDRTKEKLLQEEENEE
ncbi:MAG: hypothetical protein MJ212_02020 [Alphaproteobacteria bacterium]|nr:hypothetical protein [Alphaproteobacteria bacterium]